MHGLPAMRQSLQPEGQLRRAPATTRGQPGRPCRVPHGRLCLQILLAEAPSPASEGSALRGEAGVSLLPLQIPNQGRSAAAHGRDPRLSRAEVHTWCGTRSITRDVSLKSCALCLVGAEACRCGRIFRTPSKLQEHLMSRSMTAISFSCTLSPELIFLDSGLSSPSVDSSASSPSHSSARANSFGRVCLYGARLWEGVHRGTFRYNAKMNSLRCCATAEKKFAGSSKNYPHWSKCICLQRAGMWSGFWL